MHLLKHTSIYCPKLSGAKYLFREDLIKQTDVLGREGERDDKTTLERIITVA